MPKKDICPQCGTKMKLNKLNILYCPKCNYGANDEGEIKNLIREGKIMKSNEIKEQQLQLQYKVEQLEKERQKAMVAEGKGYTCKTPKCGIFVNKETAGKAAVESGLCENCFSRKWKAEKQNDLMRKLKFAKIVNIELNGPYDIETITVHKNGMLYDLKAEYDRDMDDEAKLVIDNEYKDEKQYSLTEPAPEIEKPWQKPRAEKKLC